MVWALMYEMPEQNRLEQEQEQEDDDENGDEDEVNALEKATGYDLDGDGDAGDAGKRDSQAASARLRIPHEAWVACERIIESDLVLQHVIPIDQRFLVRGMLPAGLPPYPFSQPCATRSALPLGPPLASPSEPC
eukprot:COSAG03_NODE_836_length_5676_cov_6.651605_1_plen_134_part_00